ncbi:hypothetical protein [Bacillus toyonensis]|uniref:hypothetical protein n=1 Tax=Bacillus toyonensis TaxID=155322 RepID=UPI0015CF296D|nr:hypothetical protein [Bacillus toyonensis]
MLVNVKHFVKATGLSYFISFSGDIALANHYHEVKNTLFMYLNKIQSTFSFTSK